MEKKQRNEEAGKRWRRAIQEAMRTGAVRLVMTADPGIDGYWMPEFRPYRPRFQNTPYPAYLQFMVRELDRRAKEPAGGPLRVHVDFAGGESWSCHAIWERMSDGTDRLLLCTHDQAEADRYMARLRR